MGISGDQRRRWIAQTGSRELFGSDTPAPEWDRILRTSAQSLFQVREAAGQRSSSVLHRAHCWTGASPSSGSFGEAAIIFLLPLSHFSSVIPDHFGRCAGCPSSCTKVTCGAICICSTVLHKASRAATGNVLT